MIEAVVGLHARRSEPVEARSEPPEPPEAPERSEVERGRGGVALRRLRAVAALTPAQAALLVTDVVDQVELARGQGLYPVRFREDAVVVSENGHLTIECSRGAESGHDQRGPVVSLLRSISANCRGCALADRWDESDTGTTDLADVVRRVRSAAATELNPGDERRIRRQLGALVSATMGRPVPDGRGAVEQVAVPSGPRVEAGTSLAADGWFPPVRNPWHRKRSRPSRRQGALGLLAILIFVAAASMAPRAWSELRRGWDPVLNPVNPAEQNQIQPVSPPPPEPSADQPAPARTDAGRAAPPVDVGAPASAGPITLVTATLADGRCASGQACEIRVDVHLDPAASVGAVTWRVNVYDRCSGEVRPNNEVLLPVHPGSQQVYGIVRTDLPPGTALAVAAITSAPATAASEPLLVPAENARC
ncbi:hypothetical protein FXW78_25725 [Rhodococcus opacus]|nr:hypothetical protein [Rhodococcus opacus]